MQKIWACSSRVERQTYNLAVDGSSPSMPTIPKFFDLQSQILFMASHYLEKNFGMS